MNLKADTVLNTVVDVVYSPLMSLTFTVFNVCSELLGNQAHVQLSTSLSHRSGSSAYCADVLGVAMYMQEKRIELVFIP